MHGIALLLLFCAVAWSSGWAAQPEERPEVPGINDRLNHALGSEGGVQVYVDPEGRVGTVIDQPGGERTVTVQPPASQSRNLGPPLQLHDPPRGIVTPAAPSPEFSEHNQLRQP